MALDRVLLIRVKSGPIRHPDKTLSPGIVLDESHPGAIPPETPHHLELIGSVTLAIEFYDRKPATFQQV